MELNLVLVVTFFHPSKVNFAVLKLVSIGWYPISAHKTNHSLTKCIKLLCSLNQERVRTTIKYRKVFSSPPKTDGKSIGLREKQSLICPEESPCSSSPATSSSWRKSWPRGGNDQDCRPRCRRSSWRWSGEDLEPWIHQQEVEGFPSRIVRTAAAPPSCSSPSLRKASWCSETPACNRGPSCTTRQDFWRPKARRTTRTA